MAFNIKVLLFIIPGLFKINKIIQILEKLSLRKDIIMGYPLIIALFSKIHNIIILSILKEWLPLHLLLEEELDLAEMDSSPLESKKLKYTIE